MRLLYISSQVKYFKGRTTTNKNGSATRERPGSVRFPSPTSKRIRLRVHDNMTIDEQVANGDEYVERVETENYTADAASLERGQARIVYGCTLFIESTRNEFGDVQMKPALALSAVTNI